MIINACILDLEAGVYHAACRYDPRGEKREVTFSFSVEHPRHMVINELKV